MATICCSPPDSVPAICWARSARIGNNVWMRSSVRVQFTRPDSRIGAHFQVFQHGQGLEHLSAFGDMRDAEMRALRSRQATAGPALEADRARRWVDHTRNGLEQCRLAGAIGPDDSDELALGNASATHRSARAGRHTETDRLRDLKHPVVPATSCRDRPRSPICPPPPSCGEPDARTRAMIQHDEAVGDLASWRASCVQ